MIPKSNYTLFVAFNLCITEVKYLNQNIKPEAVTMKTEQANFTKFIFLERVYSILQKFIFI